MRTRTHTALIGLLIAAYLATWSAAVLQAIAFPVCGAGPAKIAASGRPTGEKPRVSIVQRRHMPLVKVVTIPALLPSDDRFQSTRPWCYGNVRIHQDALSSPPDHAVARDRAPPSC